jgi:hypothetical protein
MLWIVTAPFSEASGFEAANLLNERYKSTPDQCTGENAGAAYLCSGVMIHGKNNKDTYLPFWFHDSQAERLGAEPFTYLRADIGTRALTSRSGVVLGDISAPNDLLPAVDVLCAYTFAPNVQGDWKQFGCLTPDVAPSQVPDQSSCLASGVTDTETWLTHFKKVDRNVDRQCSLSGIDPIQFMASIQAHDRLGSEWSARPNQLQVRNWEVRPDAISVAAIFYDPGQVNSLLDAQQHQIDYFKATHQWLPVLRVDLTNPDGNIFTYVPANQIYVGYEVAERINTRYMDTRRECPDNKAAFYCNGVLLRGVVGTTAYHAWNPSPGSITNNGVSFSFLRTDLKIRVIFGYSGLIFKNANAIAPTPITVRCAYPGEAGTSGSSDPCTFRGVCEDQGIRNLQDWLRVYKGVGSCAFSNSARQFAVSNQITARYVNGGFNEVMVAAWPNDVPTRLPLEAIVYRVNSPGERSLEESQYIQRDYYNETQRYLPLLGMDQAEPENPIFSFDPMIQNKPGTPRVIP